MPNHGGQALENFFRILSGDFTLLHLYNFFEKKGKNYLLLFILLWLGVLKTSKWEDNIACKNSNITWKVSATRLTV